MRHISAGYFLQKLAVILFSYPAMSIPAIASITLSISDGTQSTDGNYTVIATTSSSCPWPGICDYEFWERKNGGSWTFIPGCMGTTQTSCSITVDRSAGSYEYYVFLTIKDEHYQSPVESITVTIPPSVPSSLSLPATDPDGSYSFSWGVVSGATRYEWQEKKNSGSWSSNTSTTSLSVNRSGRTSGVWRYRVRACNSGACSDYSSTKSVKVAITPGVPASITAQLRQDGMVSVSWGASSGSVTAYDMDRKKSGSSYSSSYDGPDLETIENLGIGSYTFRVRACKMVSGYKNCSGWRTSSSFTQTATTVSYEYDALGRLIEVVEAN